MIDRTIRRPFPAAVNPPAVFSLFRVQLTGLTRRARIHHIRNSEIDHYVTDYLISKMQTREIKTCSPIDKFDNITLNMYASHRQPGALKYWFWALPQLF